jgi:ketosteroid isomerase-like protein
VAHPNEQLLARIYDTLAEGDVNTLMASLTDDVQWRVHRPSPVAGTYTGKEEVLGFFPAMMAPYAGTLQVQVTAIAADDHHGFVAVKESAQRPVEGLSWTGVHVWSFRNGMCARFESYYDDAYDEFWSGRSSSGAKS